MSLKTINIKPKTFKLQEKKREKIFPLFNPAIPKQVDVHYNKGVS